MAGPLAGVRVLDMSAVLMGPLATQVLADLGADVVKVESKDGDITRSIGPGRHPDMCSLYLALNRNKRSIVLDLKKPAGRQALLKLAEGADVFMYNLRPQAMARLGLSYEEVRVVNPRIIYCGAYGFGQLGPYAAKPAYDDLIQGMSGISYLISRMTGKPGYAPFALADHLVGTYAVHCVTAALYHRERSGEGQSVEVPMFETMVHTILTHHLYGRTFEPPLGEAGYVRQIAPNRRPYATKDGYLCILIVTDTQWRRFFDEVGRSELKTDPRFKDLASRTRHTGELYQFLEETLATRTTEDWLQIFEELDIPAMAMHTLDSLLADPHLNAVGFLRKVEHPTEGAVTSMAVPSRWSASVPEDHRLPAPRLGEHTVAILRDAGYTEADISALIAAGAAVSG
ncbi:MAG: CoA transferase [Betaproteobacteria bacterium]|nr:MAG: CoA transferase [Betaproteobacteria bacterium]